MTCHSNNEIIRNQKKLTKEEIIEKLKNLDLSYEVKYFFHYMRPIFIIHNNPDFDFANFSQEIEDNENHSSDEWKENHEKKCFFSLNIVWGTRTTEEPNYYKESVLNEIIDIGKKYGGIISVK